MKAPQLSSTSRLRLRAAENISFHIAPMMYKWHPSWWHDSENIRTQTSSTAKWCYEYLLWHIWYISGEIYEAKWNFCCWKFYHKTDWGDTHCAYLCCFIWPGHRFHMLIWAQKTLMTLWGCTYIHSQQLGYNSFSPLNFLGIKTSGNATSTKGTSKDVGFFNIRIIIIRSGNLQSRRYLVLLFLELN